METIHTLTLSATALACALLLKKLHQRLQLSMAKHPSLGGHLRMSKRVAGWIPAYSYRDEDWFAADQAPLEVADQRKHALQALAQRLKSRSPLTLAMSAEVKPMISDLQLISQYRVPYQFREQLSQHITLGSFWRESEGAYLTDMDGNQFFDVTGSYGVNLFGLDFYKQCIAQGVERAQQLGPVLGSYHPSVLENVKRLCEISGMQEVSFHMSGTEAVMQAVRLARYHSRKRKIVRFTGAYHGWWDDVQPGPGNPMPPSSDTLTLNDMHPNTLRVLRNRNDIACVLVNPLQAMHPNKSAPTDSTLVDGSRSIHYDRQAYTDWLQQLRQVCTDKGIALIMDEVFLGFRLAPGGAQEYFNVKADLVTYGKTLGGGLPVGVICGMSRWMKRFDENRPADLCFARGTFNAHPYVMTTMQVFLEKLQTEDIKQLYARNTYMWTDRMQMLNTRLQQADVPVQVAGMESVWSIVYSVPGRYNWMLQFYLRDQGVALSWVGSGRMIFSMAIDDAAFEVFVQRFILAAQHMKNDGWFWVQAEQTNRRVRQHLLKEMLNKKWIGAT
jgi:glutamate-1-semialdehyde 2,1-aminomutase